MDEFGYQLLKGVSRSFYLSLRLLPGPMREAASVAYLLARTSDTVADVSGVEVKTRLEALADFEHCLNHGGEGVRWCRDMLDDVSDVRERSLLDHTQDCLAWLEHLPEGERVLVMHVVNVIISGQRFDLEYFGDARAGMPRAIEGGDMLDDYTWKVAGCVGEFWTRLGFLTLGEQFSKRPQDELVRSGIEYGKGLQLVNILRDLPEDVEAGRCYLPVADPSDREALMNEYQAQLERAESGLSSGLDYTEGLEMRRLQVASGLPAMIGVKTLNLMRQAGWDELQAGIKIPRIQVYGLMLRAFVGSFR